MNEAEKLKKIMAENLRTYLNRAGKSQSDVAKDLNIPLMTFSNWLNAKTYPRVDKIQLLADYFRISRSDLTEEKPSNIQPISPPTVRIPILGKIACGDPITAEENIEGYLYKSPDGLPKGELLALRAKGDSMSPTIPDGAHVIIRHQSDAENGELVAVRVNDNVDATLKRLKKQGNTIILMPDNQKYDPIVVTEDNPVSIIGKVVSYEVRF